MYTAESFKQQFNPRVFLLKRELKYCFKRNNWVRIVIWKKFSSKLLLKQWPIPSEMNPYGIMVVVSIKNNIHVQSNVAHEGLTSKNSSFWDLHCNSIFNNSSNVAPLDWLSVWWIQRTRSPAGPSHRGNWPLDYSLVPSASSNVTS